MGTPRGRFGGRTAVALVAGALVAAGAVATAGAGDGRAVSLNGMESQWLNSGLPDDREAALHSTIGYRAPAIPGEVTWTGDGPTPRLDDWAGRVVVLQSWSSATPSGRAALRHAERLLRAFPDDQVTLVGLHTPEESERMDDVPSKDIPAPSLVDPVGAFCDELGVYKRPVTIVIDQNGVIRYPGVSLAGLRQSIDHLLENGPGDADDAEVLPPRGDRDIPRATPNARLADTGFPPKSGGVRGARDVRGKQAPDVVVQKYLTPEPDLEGKVVMVEFWATWCGPCIRGIPHLNDLQSRFRNDLVVIGVSDEDESKVRGFMRKTRMDYTVAIDPRRRMAGFTEHRGIPHTMVISPDGVVRWQGHPAQLDEATMGRIVAASAAAGGSGGEARWVTDEG
jgi:cytochrome c biogenesis protein CcmG/thiol:disulfide interchange protein DsbE